MARDIGIEGGSFGYLNNYAIIGGRNDRLEGTAFASDVRGDGYISHSSFNTQTLNALGTYSATPDDRFTVKVIENCLSTNLPCGFRSTSSRPTRSSAAAQAQLAPRRDAERSLFLPTVFLRQPFPRPRSKPASAATTRAASWARGGSMISTAKRRGERKPSSTTRTSISRPERRAPSATAPRTT